MKKNKSYQIAFDGLLAALTAVFGYLAIDMGFLKLSFEEFPVILAALMFGPADGALVGGIGTFLYQLLRYGLDVTTVLWILPYILLGTFVGIYAKKHGFVNTDGQIRKAILGGEILVIALNTVVIFLDAKIKMYPVPIAFASTLWRIAAAAVKTVLFGFLTPQILKKLSKFTGNVRKA